MTEYRVRWEIDVDGDNPRSAALAAKATMDDPRSWATAFEVTGPEGDTHVDLSDEVAGPPFEVAVDTAVFVESICTTRCGVEVTATNGGQDGPPTVTFEAPPEMVPAIHVGSRFRLLVHLWESS